MKNDFLQTKFFLAANTPRGFFSVFDHLYYPKKDWFCYILKGGPGTGKSTLMHKLAERAMQKFIKTEMIYCSSDPASLDAVIFPDLKIAVADGTAPHILDPIYPGVSDMIVNLGDCWNSNFLAKKRGEIIDLSDENSKLHAKSKKYLSAFSFAYSEIENIVLDCLDCSVLENYCEKLLKKILNKKSKNKIRKGEEELRFISSITPFGHIFFDNTLASLADNIFVIEDKYEIVGSVVLNSLKEKILNLGYNVTACPSPFSPYKQLNALFVPDLNAAFAVKSSIKDIDIAKNYTKVTTKKFLRSEIIAKHKNFINFNQKLCREFFNLAVENLSKALKVHDKLEKIYKESMNYKKVKKITDELTSAIFKEL